MFVGLDFDGAENLSWMEELRFLIILDWSTVQGKDEDEFI
jgi:hypothetical protein